MLAWGESAYTAGKFRMARNPLHHQVEVDLATSRLAAQSQEYLNPGFSR